VHLNKLNAPVLNVLKSVTCSIILWYITNFTLCIKEQKTRLTPHELDDYDDDDGDGG